MTSSIERDVEDAIAQALTIAGVTGVNIYTSERTSGRLLPFVSIVASIKSEEIAPFTGVFDLNCTITYVARADTIADQAYDQKFASIQQAFYTEPNLASQMTSAQYDLEFYIADITKIGQRIISTSRTWARDIFIDVKVTPKQIIPINNLALWLKADAGVTISAETFISQVVISDAGTITSNGTYIRSYGGNSVFNGPNGNYIYNLGGTQWVLYDTQLYNPEIEEYGADSYYTEDFISWHISAQVLGENPAPSGVTATTTTDSVTAWADQSGNGNNATAHNNTQLVQNALNSKPAISFNGVASYATFPISLSTGTDRTIFIVGKYNDLNRGQEGFLALVFGGSLDRGYVFRESQTDATYYYTPSQIAAPTLTSVGNYHIAIVKHNFVGDSTMGINGSFGEGGQCNLSEINQGNIAQRGEGQEYASVNIAEIIIYNQALTTQKLQQVEEYLNTKYAIY
jgi:hypothetical protein